MKRAFIFGLLAAVTTMAFVGGAEAGHRRWRRHAYYYSAPTATVTTPAPAPATAAKTQADSGRQGYSSAYQAPPAPATTTSAPVMVAPSGSVRSSRFAPAWGFGSGSPLQGIERMHRQVKSQW